MRKVWARFAIFAGAAGVSVVSCGDGAKDAACPAGSERCACYGNDTCDGALSCHSGLCVDTSGQGGDTSSSGGNDGSSSGGAMEPPPGGAGGSAPTTGGAGSASGGRDASGGADAGGGGGASGGTDATGGTSSHGGSGGTSSGGMSSGGVGGVTPPGDTPVFSQLDLGVKHSCGVLTDGSVYCWGTNLDGMLGDGTAVNQTRPVKVKDLTGVTAVSAGSYRTCALLADTTVRCWSANPGGSLGSGKIAPSATPTEVPGLSGVVAISTGYQHSCALLADATLRCWGTNSSGQLGIDSTILVSEEPVEVPGLSDVAEVAVGDLHTCARLENGEVWCWGYNFYHQVSPTDAEVIDEPVKVENLPFAYSLTAGGSHNCAIIEKPDTFPPYGNVLCWGSNGSAQLGSAAIPGFGEPNGHITVTMIATGHSHNCGLSKTNILWCWGINTNGELGLNYKGDPGGGVVEGLGSVPLVQVALGDSHSCALHQDGSAQCWGLNNQGQLGIGTPYSTTSPAYVQLAPTP